MKYLAGSRLPCTLSKSHRESEYLKKSRVDKKVQESKIEKKEPESLNSLSVQKSQKQSEFRVREFRKSLRIHMSQGA